MKNWLKSIDWDDPLTGIICWIIGIGLTGVVLILLVCLGVL